MEQEGNGTPEGVAATPLADIVGKRERAPAPPPAGQQAAPPAPPPAPPKGEEPKPEAPKAEAAPQRTPDGKFAPKDKEAAPPAEDDDKPSVPVAALRDERAKRQKAEAEASRVLSELEAIKREIATLRSQPPAYAQQPPQPMPQPAPQPEAPAPDFWTDPDAYFAHRLGEHERKIRTDMVNRHLGMSEAAARARHQDFDAALNEFAEAMRANPMLREQMVNAPDPGEFVYQVGKRAMTVKPLLTDPDGYRKQLEAELRAKLEAEYAAKMAAQPAPEPVATPPAPLPPLPTSLASVRSVSPRTGPTWSGPAPLDAIIGPRARSATRPR